VNSSHAQISTILTRLTAQRALTNTNITTKTGSRSITPLIVGYSDDSIMAIMYSLAGLTGAAGDLDAVLTLGNTSDLDIEIVKNGVEGEFYTKHMYNGCQTIHNPSGGGSEYEVTFLGRVGGNNVLYLRDAFGFFGYMGSGTLTADRKVLLPDEGDGVGLDATLVTHTTGDPITVTNSTYTGTYGDASAVITDGSGSTSSMFSTYVEAAYTAGTELDRLNLYPTKLEYKYTNSVGPISKTSYLHFDRPSFTSGTQNVWFPSATNDTLAVKGDITAMGNFATADLTFTGNRYHNVDRYNVDIDSANKWNFKDTSGNYMLTLDDTTKSSSAMLYAASTPTKREIRLNASGSLSMFLEQTSASTRLAVTNNAASFTVDSASKSVGISHLSGLTSAPATSAGTGAGTGGVVSLIVGATDLSGTIDVATGTTCATDAIVATITFNVSYATAPKCIHITPANKLTQNLAKGQECFIPTSGTTTTKFELTSNGTALADGAVYQWYYFIVQ